MQGVLFDLDRTLVDRDGMHRLYCRQLADRLAADQSPEDRERLFGQLIEVDRKLPDRAEYFGWLAQQFPQAGLTGDALWEEYRETSPRMVQAFPGAVELVRWLAETRRVGVITNGSSKTQRTKLRVTGLDELVSTIIVSGEAGCEKPAAEIFRLGLDGLGVAASDALFVGDDARRDIAGGKNAGMATCWISAPGEPFPPELAPPDYRIETVAQLRTVLG